MVWQNSPKMMKNTKTIESAAIKDNTSKIHKQTLKAIKESPVKDANSNKYIKLEDTNMQPENVYKMTKKTW